VNITFEKLLPMKCGFTLSFVLLFLTLGSATAQKTKFFKENDKWGLMLKDKVIVPPTYDQVENFHHGLAKVSLHHLSGYINSTGKVVIPLIYEDGLSFTDDITPVKKNGRWGYINLHGKPITEFVYEKAWSMQNSLAGVRLNGKEGCINNKGEIVIPIEYDYVGFYNEGLIPVAKDGLWGYVDINNQVKIPFIYEETYEFSGKFGFVFYKGKYGMIDKTGKWIIPAEFNSFEPYPWLHLVVMERDQHYEIWNEEGIKLTDQVFTMVQEEFNEYLRVGTGDFQGIINSKGEVIVAPEYSFIEITESGTITLGKDGKFGVYDIESKSITLPIIYDQVGYPEGGDYYLTLGNKQGIYNVKKKKVLVEPLYDGIEEHSMGYYLIWKDGRVGLINPEGKVLLEPIYSIIEIRKKKTIIAVTPDEVYEYYTLDGKRIEKK
jgi:hypothetical protein